ncbi:MAG: hypothetical protein OXI63_02055 [Candidatus Poribacteria bacterium]|nr:hypothetical protein [Candidatus Poribacteria bacterium]
MHNVSFEESRKHVPADALGAIHVYRPHTDFSEFIMDVVENIREMDLQRIVILVQKGVSKSVIDDATQRIAELLEGEKLDENKKIALECFHGLTRVELRRLKRQWERSRTKRRKRK